MKNLVRYRKALLFFFAASIVALFAILNSKGGNSPEAWASASVPSGEKLPLKYSVQEEFEMLWPSKINDYDKAGDDASKSAIFDKIGSDAAAIISSKGSNFSEWVGIVDFPSIRQGGGANVSLKSPNGASYKMNGEAFNGSELFRQICALKKKGDLVKFSGSFTKCDGKLECSYTRRGALESPEFLINLRSIVPLTGEPPAPSMSL